MVYQELSGQINRFLEAQGHDDLGSGAPDSLERRLFCMDSTATIGELKDRVEKFRDQREWGKYHKPKDLAVSVAIEAGELMEFFQWKSDAEVEQALAEPAKREEFCDELADVLCYCLLLASAAKVDLSDAVASKMSKNEAKYPVEKVKGNWRKYDEL